MNRFAKCCLCAVVLLVSELPVARSHARAGLRYAEPFLVEGLGPGMRVAPNSQAYKRYKCHPSEAYQDSIVCRFFEVKDGVKKHLTILHLNDNTVVYVNKSVAPAFFSGPQVDSEIKRLSATFRTGPRIYSSRQGVIATWGAIRLEPVSSAGLASLASGKHVDAGFMVDHLMNLYDSAREGLPVYGLAGGRGYVWIARFEEERREGALRFLAADPSQMKHVSPQFYPDATVAVTPPSIPRSYGPASEPAMVAMEKDGGVYVVPARLNDVITLPALVDSGAADVSLPPDVVLTLSRSGTISQDDFIGEQTYMLADGSKIPSPRFRLKSVRVGNRTIENVEAAIAPNVEANILLGQSFLGRLQSWSIDNDHHVLILK